MLYPKNIEEKLGFDKIRELLSEKCNGEVAKGFVEKIRFSNKIEIIRKHTAQVDEFIRILGSGNYFPAHNFIDVSHILRKCAIEGTYLLEDEAYDLKRALTTLQECLSFFDLTTESLYPTLYALSKEVTFDRMLLREIDRVIDEKGKVRNNASKELASIRSQLQAEQASIRNKVDQLLRSLKAQGMAKDEALPTIRDGRIVVPVAAEYKRRVKGFVHDTSSTGQTVFIEPEELLNINNEIKDLLLRERNEIIRILMALTDKIRPQADKLESGNMFIGMMDFIRAKALLAREMDGTLPEIVDAPLIEWYNAIHPLLLLYHKPLGKPVIAQNLCLRQEEGEGRIMIISGPNAGGKSITLKMVGLLQYMLQCGLLVPVLETSKMGVFADIFMDYGDDQSLENDLSTYSSHLTNMRYFLKHAGDSTLILADEFGGGTEPELGGAIAEAILEQLNNQQSWGVFTTHYANLKVYADKTPGLVNGAMRYDVENLEPLYRLEQGQPGSSFALEIAQKIGLPKGVVNNARQKAGRKKISMEELLRDLEQEKKEFREKNRELRQKENQLKQSIEKYEVLRSRVEGSKDKMLNKAKAEAARILQTTNKRIENAIREIRESKADKDISKLVREDLEQLKQEFAVEPIAPTPAEPKEEIEIIGGSIQVGDFVKFKDSETIGEVISLNGKDARLLIGSLQSNVKLQKLVKISRRDYKRETRERYSTLSASSNILEKQVNFSPTLDIRGKRAEEVTPLLDTFIDNALMIGQQELRVIHGKGNGILREIVRQHLKGFSGIRNIADEHADRGGAGVTVVTLR